MRVLWNISDWVAALRELPACGPLPSRMAIVPNTRIGLALQRALAATAPELLAGTKLTTVGPLAGEILRAAGTTFCEGEDALREARVAALLRGPALPLRYFDPTLMRSTPGWAAAVAASVTDLEAAGLRPQQLDPARERSSDLQEIWRALDDSAGTSWTWARVLAEADNELWRRPDLWRFDGPVLAAVWGSESQVEAAFLRCIPDVELGIVAARPRRQRFIARQRALWDCGD